AAHPRGGVRLPPRRLSERDHQRLGSHGNSGSQASAYQRAESGMPNKWRATPRVVLVLEEDGIVDGGHVGGEVMVAAKKPISAVDAEGVLQLDAIQHVDQDPAHR